MATERPVGTLSGWAMLPAVIGLDLLAVALIVAGAVLSENGDKLAAALLIVPGVLLLPLTLFLWLGFFTLQPNEARALVLLGQYRGTVREPGYHWANPFSLPPSQRVRLKVSLRARNLETEKLKVNDRRGNPIEIGAVIVWRVTETAQALFDVDDYERYVKVQSESALRHLANSYSYDHAEREEDEVTLRGHAEAVCATLVKELCERLGKAGVKVDEARLTHLAYAPEIAGAMLRRQQAEAVIAARQKIVQGAVSMVEMALHGLSEKNLVQLDEERKAAMVGNLLVVLCGEAETHPILNVGTLYH